MQKTITGEKSALPKPKLNFKPDQIVNEVAYPAM